MSDGVDAFAFAASLLFRRQGRQKSQGIIEFHPLPFLASWRKASLRHLFAQNDERLEIKGQMPYS